MQNQNRYQALVDQLKHLEASYHLHLCVKDYVGFIPIDKTLSAALSPWLGHTNPYCMFIKQDQRRYHHCLSMMKKMADKCLRECCAYQGVCYAGVCEYVAPILWENKLLGAITAGFWAVEPKEAESRLNRAMAGSSSEDVRLAMDMYRQHIIPTAVDPQVILPPLNLLASYLAMTYHMGRESVTGEQLTHSRKSGNAEEIFVKAISFLHQEYQNRVTVSLLASECHCSESYLNHMLKRRLGVSMSTYLNKLRIEHAKEYLLETDDTMLSIALQVGFQDSNYFARVFKELMGIQPSEFRRRYR